MRNCLAFALILALSSPAVGMDDDLPWDPQPGSNTHELCTDAIAAKKAKLSSVNLGGPVGSMRVVSSSFCWQAYQYGRIHSAAGTGGPTAAIYGPVLSRFATLGYESGFGQAYTDPLLDQQTGAVTSRFSSGYIVSHPTYGVKTLRNPLAWLWRQSSTYQRLGYPVTEVQSSGGVTYQRFQRGYIANSNELGVWSDFTGTNGSAVGASVQLYQHSFSGNTLTYALSNEKPLVLRPQFGVLDEQTSSLSVKLPARASLYLYDQSPLEGRYVRITGADNAKIRVAALGSWMNDLPSSMMLVDHGTVSGRKSVADLTADITANFQKLDSAAIVRNALRSHLASGSLRWNNDLTVKLLPGERLLQITRSAYLDINAECVGIPGLCNADGNVLFTMAVRPYVVTIPNPSDVSRPWPSVHVQLIEGNALSLSCSGFGCDDRDAALVDLMSPGGSVATMIEGTFSREFDAALDDFSSLDVSSAGCPGIGIRRVNVLPDSLEFVVGDDAAMASCAAGSFAGPRLDSTRVTSVTTGSTNGGAVTAFDGSFTVVPDFDLPVLK